MEYSAPCIEERVSHDVIMDCDGEHVWIQVRRAVYEDLERIRKELGFTNINDVIALLVMGWV